MCLSPAIAREAPYFFDDEASLLVRELELDSLVPVSAAAVPSIVEITASLALELRRCCLSNYLP